MFRRHRVLPFLPQVQANVARFLQLWREKYPTSDAVNANPNLDLKRLTLDVFGQIAYAENFHCIEEIAGGQAGPLGQATSDVLDGFTRVIPAFLLPYVLMVDRKYQRGQKVNTTNDLPLCLFCSLARLILSMYLVLGHTQETDHLHVHAACVSRCCVII